MKKILHEIFVKDIGKKLIALGLSILLWYYIQQQEKGETLLKVPLKISNVPQELSISTPMPKYVTFRLTGPKKLIERVKRGNIKAYIDMRKAQPGENLFKIKYKRKGLPDQVFVKEIVPSEVRVTLEPVAVAQVLVNPTIVGEPYPGYEKKNVNVNPPFINISGPASKISSIRSVPTEPVEITDATTTVVRKVKPILPTGVKSKPAEVEVTVTITPQLMQRAFENIPVVPKNVSPHLDVSINPPVVNLVLEGPREIMEELNPEDIKVWIDLSGFDRGTYKLPASVEVPEGVSIYSANPELFDVKIK